MYCKTKSRVNHLNLKNLGVLNTKSRNGIIQLIAAFQSVFPDEIIERISNFTNYQRAILHREIQSVHHLKRSKVPNYEYIFGRNYDNAIRPSGSLNFSHIDSYPSLGPVAPVMRTCPYQKYYGNCACGGIFKHIYLNPSI